jgi:hypothetical protein
MFKIINILRNQSMKCFIAGHVFLSLLLLTINRVEIPENKKALDIRWSEFNPATAILSLRFRYYLNDENQPHPHITGGIADSAIYHLLS